MRETNYSHLSKKEVKTGNTLILGEANTPHLKKPTPHHTGTFFEKKKK